MIGPNISHLNPEPLGTEERFRLWREALCVYSSGDSSTPFGGFTPIEWEATVGATQGDSSHQAGSPEAPPHSFSLATQTPSQCENHCRPAAPGHNLLCIWAATRQDSYELLGTTVMVGGKPWSNLGTGKNEISLPPRSCMGKAGKVNPFCSQRAKSALSEPRQGGAQQASRFNLSLTG